MDQPGLMMDMFRVIDNAVADVEAYRNEEAQRAAKKSQMQGARRAGAGPAMMRSRPRPPRRR